MSLRADIDQVIAKIESLHLEDPTITRYWQEMTELLSKDEAATVSLFQSLQEKRTVEHLASVFDDVAFRLQSPKFIASIEALEVRFPDPWLKVRVEAARDNMLDSEDA